MREYMKGMVGVGRRSKDKEDLAGKDWKRR